jgi:hypothetical protein
MTAGGTQITAQTEFDDDQRVVLEENYLNSAEAVSEIYEEELAKVANNLEVDSLRQAPGFFRGTLLATLLWAIPSAWTICQ